jgi:NADPH2:quinone reductase
VPVVFLTSWFALMKRAGLRAGETVLVQSAGSGCGIAGIAIAKWAGATVITTAGSDEKVQRGLAIGADHGINYSTHDFAEEVRRITGGAGVDVCLESVGGDVYTKSVGLLQDGGRLVSVGRSSETSEDSVRGVADPEEVARRGLSVQSFALPSTVQSGEAPVEIAVITDLFEQRRLRTVVDQVFPMSRVHDALAYLDGRRNFGKVVMKPWE